MGRTLFGECFLCNNTYTRSGMSNHLRACLRRHVTSDDASAPSFMHLAVTGANNPEYWMHLLIPADATLAKLDAMLRAVWLDCCDHYSMFSISGTTYRSHHAAASPLNPGKATESMHFPLQAVLQKGDTFAHTYDLNNPTALNCRVVDTVAALPPAPDDGAVLARNIAPELLCHCGELAVACAPAPANSSLLGPLFCDQCVIDHTSADHPLLPVTNSPRTGMCSYVGSTADYPEPGQTLTGHAAFRGMVAAELSAMRQGHATALATWPTLHPATLHRAFAAAARFYVESPWDVLWTDEVLTVTLGSRTFYAVILGEHNDIFGMAVYATKADVKTALAPALNGRTTTPKEALGMFFGPAEALPPAAAQLVVKTGLPLAAPDAFPLIVRTHGKRWSALDYSEVEIVVALLQAVSAFVNRHSDRLARGMETRDTVPVRTPHIIGAAVQYSPHYF